VFWRREVVQGVLLDQAGYITLGDKPGLGLVLDQEAIKKYPVKEYGDFNYEYEDEIAINRRRKGTD